jgi:hypothetical protein
MSQDQKSIEKTNRETHATKIWANDASRKDAGSGYNVTEIAFSSHALDRMLSRLKLDIIVEQEAMDELITRLRKRA